MSKLKSIKKALEELSVENVEVAKNQSTLKDDIDRFCMLKEEIAKLESEAEELSNKFKAELPHNKWHIGHKYKIMISERTTPVFDNVKVLGLLKNDFLNVVNVVKKEALKYVSEKELDKCISNYKKTIYIEKDTIK